MNAMQATPDAIGQKPADRLFVAVELSEEITARLRNVQTLISGLKWTPAANLHLTLRFIGQVPQDRVALLQQALCRVKGDAFRLTLAGLGLFQQRMGGILWAGVKKEPALMKLKQQVDEALWVSADLSSDEKAYSPHVTLSRLKKPISAPLKNLVQKNAAEHFGAIDVTEFVLFRSLLRPSGAIHEPVERYRLTPRRCAPHKDAFSATIT
jgi:2'-5' RNA ligase